MAQKMAIIGLPPLKYTWTKAYLLRPVDNIVSHPDTLRKRPFRPSYEAHGAPYLPCLLRYDYFRIWKEEHAKFQACKSAMTKPPKKKFSPYRKKPIRGTYCGAGCAKHGPQKARFVMKQFRCVPAKVDHFRTECCPGHAVQAVCCNDMVSVPPCC